MSTILYFYLGVCGCGTPPCGEKKAQKTGRTGEPVRPERQKGKSYWLAALEPREEPRPRRFIPHRMATSTAMATGVTRGLRTKPIMR